MFGDIYGVPDLTDQEERVLNNSSGHMVDDNFGGPTQSNVSGFLANSSGHMVDDSFGVQTPDQVVGELVRELDTPPSSTTTGSSEQQ